MKQDKEYPATHSMSTAWYMVDDEGNVGIMEYNENGPIPWDVPGEECVNSLVLGLEGQYGELALPFDLTDDQIYDLLKGPFSFSDIENLWHPVIKIDLNKKERFFELVNNSKKKLSNICISEKLGLYSIDSNDVLQTIINEGIVLEVYEEQDYYLDEDDEEETYDNSPYYLYSQPYYDGDLQKRVFVPKNPVKITQIPEEFRKRIHRIKGSFDDIETMQIAQHYPCNFFFDEPSYCAYGSKYYLTILEDGTKGFVKTEELHFPFKVFCPDSNNPKCNGICWSTCYQNSRVVIENENPTVLILVSPYCKYENLDLKEVDFISNNICVLPYIYAVPCINKQQFYKQESDILELLTTDYMLKVFKTAKGYLEKIIEYQNPHVIITFDNAFDVLNQTYKIKNCNIEINNSVFPIYQSKEIKPNRDKIKTLANQEYRGKTSPLVISQEEMQELEKENIAIKIKD